MKVPATFGTQAELYAAASLFQIPVYVFYKRSEEEGWEWMMYESRNKENLQTPAHVTERAPENVWIELLHTTLHFDVIYSKSLARPQLPGVCRNGIVDLTKK